MPSSRDTNVADEQTRRQKAIHPIFRQFQHIQISSEIDSVCSSAISTVLLPLSDHPRLRFKPCALSSVCMCACCLIAKFHYTEPTGPGWPTKSAHVVEYELNSTTRTQTRHGPDTDQTRSGRGQSPVADKVRARCRVRAKFHYTDPTGPARTFLRRNSVGSVLVRSGSCSGI